MADMDFRLPKEVFEAFHKRIGHGLFGYTLQLRSLAEETDIFERSIKRTVMR